MKRRAKIYRALPHHEPAWLSEYRRYAEAQAARVPETETQGQNSDVQDERCS